MEYSAILLDFIPPAFRLYPSEVRMLRFGRTALLALCATGLFQCNVDAKAQSSTVPAAKQTGSSGSLPASTSKKADSSQVDPKATNSTEVGDGTFDFLRLRTHRLEGISRIFVEDCGPDKGKCSGDGHCCLVGGSGWCCPKGKTCGEDPGECK